MKNHPFVSVLIPNYNCEKYIGESIKSILDQTYKNFECIIVDDCSTDNSWKIIQTYAKKDKRIKCVRNETNLKIVKSRNKLFDLASSKSKYYAIFDSDDISMPERLEKQVKFLELNKRVMLLGGQLKIIDEDSKEFARRKYPITNKQILKKILLYSVFAQPSVMIRKDVLKKIGYYDLKFTGIPCEDYDLWLRVSSTLPVFLIDKPYTIKRGGTKINCPAFIPRINSGFVHY